MFPGMESETTFHGSLFSWCLSFYENDYW